MSGYSGLFLFGKGVGKRIFPKRRTDLQGGEWENTRIVEYENVKYTIGVLVNSNFGSSNGKDLIFKGRYLGDLINDYNLIPEYNSKTLQDSYWLLNKF